ncbi:two-component regulator propeller domain-containing protein [Niastella sp. OAS944]|uniref:hybrid sensor histidine kinase/response regulator transcription factor n=1 Tax=Niastella sp. OAS944 TaxID=2664089 RepID=UPI00347FE174|nr:signal transduction histidine kinase/ligand-binding sensor domain-containing protein/DNA-binding response OmpR family regulator [Chitinophagaceae bacterium OAS944]
MVCKRYTLLSLYVLLSFVAAAQKTSINFTSISSKDGLLSNVVNAIIKDRQGLMWFATDDGLNKFDGTNFTVYRNITGDTTSLRVNEVLTLCEDKQGNVWVGTSGGGLSLYDRKKDNFTNYPTQNVFGGFSTKSVIRSICCDHRGKLWIAQFEGVYEFDPVTKIPRALNLGKALDRNRVKITLFCVFEDSQHRIWVGSDYGLYLYKRETDSFVRFAHNPNDATSISNDVVRTITEDSAGNLWLGTVDGLNKLPPGQTGFVRYKNTGANAIGINSNEINFVAADKEGELWLGTNSGLNKFNPATKAVSVFEPDPGNVHSLTSKNVKCAYIDKLGIYWFGTFRGGINKYDKNGNLFNLKLSNAFQENSNKAAIICALTENKKGNIYIGTDDEGLLEFDRKTEKLRRIAFPKDNNMTIPVLSLQLTHDNQLYLGTFAHGLFIRDEVTGRLENFRKGTGVNDLNSNDIFCLKEDSKGNIWVGTNGAGVNIIQHKKVILKLTPNPNGPNEEALPVNGYARAFAEDNEGNMWIGSHGAGLATYNMATHTFKVFTRDNSRLPSDKVEALLCDSHGNIWVGTYGGGLSLFDKAKNQFINFSEKDGLQNTTIYQLIEDLQGRIWLSTNTGIGCFDLSTKSFRNFNNQHGVQNNNFVHGSGIRLSDGELFFGGLQGFNYFDPAALTTNRNAPAVLLTDLRISNKSVVAGSDASIKEHISVAQEIRLDYKQNFALSFVALNYTNPKQNRYAYKLDGFDKDWNYTGTINTASYTNLDPGHYTFRVKASNNDGVWSEHETQIKIYVKPPFWATIYAYIFYFLVIAGVLLYSRYRAITKLRRKFAIEQERREVRRMQELDKLKLKFLTNLSHDFRTPISLIMGPVEQLINEDNTRGRSDKLLMIRRNARRLLNLVNQLLDFRKMEEHELKLQLSKGEFVSFIKEVCESFRDLSERKHINFTFTSFIPQLHTRFDRDKLERILFNLLSNAFKFTMSGGDVGVEIANAEKPGSAGQQWVTIKVTDTGIGIPQEEQQKIFEHFIQHSTPEHILNQGTGIGLSITKEFVKMHGGTIDVESITSKGSAFIIQIPLTVMEEQVVEIPAHFEEEIPPASGNENESLPNALSVLLIEDNEDFRFYLKDNLSNNYKILEAADGKEGWQKALACHPQLIVSDISMPGMDGITLVKKLKADKRTSHIPVILLTAVTGEEEQLRGLGTGANDYITKPFNFEVLNAKIKSLLILQHTMQNAYTKQIKVVAPEVEFESADEKLLQEIVGYLEKNLTNSQLSVETLSKEVGMSRTSLYSKLLELTGQSPVEYIRSFRLEKAAVLMEKSNMNIAEIAYQVGFTTPNYFARSFKGKFNMLPSEYIATKRQK